MKGGRVGIHIIPQTPEPKVWGSQQTSLPRMDALRNKL